MSAAPETASEWVALDKLVPWVRNPRDNDYLVEEVAFSMCRFGWGAPMIAWKEGQVHVYGDGREQAAGPRIAAGHLRRKAAMFLSAQPPEYMAGIDARLRALGLSASKVKVVEVRKRRVFHIDGAPKPGVVPLRWMLFAGEDEFEAFALRDNRGARDDLEALARLAHDHAARGHDLAAGIGFSKTDLADLEKRGREAADAAQRAAASAAASDGGSGASAGGAGARAPKGEQVLHYDLIFDDAAQQQRFFDVMRAIKVGHPEGKTFAGKLFAFFGELDSSTPTATAMAVAAAARPKA